MTDVNSGTNRWLSFVRVDHALFRLDSISLWDYSKSGQAQHVAIRGYRNGALIHSGKSADLWSTTAVNSTASDFGTGVVDSVVIIDTANGSEYLWPYVDMIAITVFRVPTALTGSASSITTSSATVAGSVSGCGYGFTCTDSIQYGTTPSYGTTIPASPATSINQFETPISAALSGLLPNTTYHYRVKAVNVDGTSYGDDATFTTACGLSGAGTEASPYLVGNYADLGQVGVRSCALSASYRQTSDIDASASAAQDSGFAPIGLAGAPFSGAYHGAGHVIAHLSIARTLRDSVGLFTHLGRSATVDSLGLDSVSVSAKGLAGGLAARSQGRIAHVFATGTVASSQGSSVGVLLGYSDSASVVQDAWVFGTATTKMPGRVYTGMFAGSAAKDTLRRVYSTGSLQGYGYMGMRDNAYSTASLDTAAYAGFDFAKTWYAAQGLAQPFLRAFLKPLTVTAKDTSRTWTGAVTGSFRSTFAPAGYEAGQVLGSLTYSGNAVTAVDPGTYALVPAGLYSTQRGYAIGYAPGSLTILPGPTGIASRPVAIPRSRELAARISHPFASVVSGPGAGRLGADLPGCTDNSCLSLELSLPSASSVRVSIFDQLGTPVISWNEVFTASDLSRIATAPDGRAPVRLSWNLRASNGAAAAPGVYLWKVEALTADGHKLETVKRMGVK